MSVLSRVLGDEWVVQFGNPYHEPAGTTKGGRFAKAPAGAPIAVGSQIAAGIHRIWMEHPVYGKETVGEFLDRHEIKVHEDGTVTLYHARPKTAVFDTLREGSYLEKDPEAARHYAARDRGLKPVRLRCWRFVFPLTLSSRAFSLRRERPLR
jgi:hypothetical protein